MVKVVINCCIGGYGLSGKAFERLMELGYNPSRHDLKWYMERVKKNDSFHSMYVFTEDEERADPMLVRVIEELGEEANSCGSELHIVEVPDDVEWYISEDECGYESIHEKHRIWCYHKN